MYGYIYPKKLRSNNMKIERMRCRFIPKRWHSFVFALNKYKRLSFTTYGVGAT